MDIKKGTRKWIKELRTKLDKLSINDEKGEEMLDNIKAYISDSEYFIEKGDLIRGFECAVWATAIFDTCKKLGVLKNKKKKTILNHKFL